MSKSKDDEIFDKMAEELLALLKDCKDDSHLKTKLTKYMKERNINLTLRGFDKVKRDS